MDKSKKSCRFPAKEFKEIFPNANIKLAKHLAKKGPWERKHILWLYGEVKPRDYPEESKRLVKKLDVWAKCQKKKKKR